MKWLSRELVESPIHLCLCRTEKSFRRVLKHLGVPKKDWPNFLQTEHANATVHHFENHGKHAAVVCMHKKQPKDISRIQMDCLLVHEAVHIWQEIKLIIGEKYPSLEFEAYAIQSISQDLIGAYHDE